MTRKVILSVALLIVEMLAYGQNISALNNLLSTYSDNIKVCNPHQPQPHSCIYDTHYMKAESQGQYLILKFGFCYKPEWGYIHEDELKIDLSSAEIGQFGYKDVVTLKDENGMDIVITGRQDYNRGTKKHLLSEFYISFGTAPIANRILKEMHAFQEKFKNKGTMSPQQGSQSPSDTKVPSPQKHHLKSWKEKMK